MGTGLITDLVANVGKTLSAESIRAMVTAIAGGRATSRHLAKALAMRPAVLTDCITPGPAVALRILAFYSARDAAPPQPRISRPQFPRSDAFLRNVTPLPTFSTLIESSPNIPFRHLPGRTTPGSGITPRQWHPS